MEGSFIFLPADDNDMTTVVDNAVTWSRDNGMENVFNAPAVALECLLMVRSKGASK